MPFHIPNLFSEYLRHQDINDYLDYLQVTYPHLVTVSVPGYSYEQRPIKLIRISSKEMYKSKISLTSSSTSITSALSLAKPKSALKISTAATCRKSRSAVPASRQRTTNAIHHRIGTKNSNNSNNNANIHQNGSNPARCNTANNFPKQQQQQAKPLTKSIVLIDGGLHAREWAAISTALYCISQLVENFECNRKLLLCYDFVIVPVVNVDGYEYSHTTVRHCFRVHCNQFGWSASLRHFFVYFEYYRIVCGEKHDDRMMAHKILERIVIEISVLIGNEHAVDHQSTHTGEIHHFPSQKRKFYAI